MPASLLARLRRWLDGAKAQSDKAPSTAELAAIDGNARLVREQLSGLAGQDLPPGRAGVEFLDGFLERNRDQIDEGTKAKLAQMAGCYLGAALIAEYGGRWIRDGVFDGSLAVEIAPQLVCYPLAKAHKQLFEGSGDSVRAFFNSVSALRNVPDDPPVEGYLTPSPERLAEIERSVQAAKVDLAIDFPPGRAGIEALDTLIKRRRGGQDAQADAKLAASAGYYLGASVIAANGGRWIHFSDEHDVAIELPKGSVIFPIELASEHLSDWAAGSLLGRFDRLTTP